MHCLSPFLCRVAVLEVIPADMGRKARYKLPVHRRHLDTNDHAHSHSHIYGQSRVTDSPNLACFWTAGGGNPRSYSTGGACRLHTERPWPENRIPKTFLLWGNRVKHCTTGKSQKFLRSYFTKKCLQDHILWCANLHTALLLQLPKVELSANWILQGGLVHSITKCILLLHFVQTI